MAAKETIALVGITYAACGDLIGKLAESYRLLLVSTKENNLTNLSQQIINDTPNAEVEVIECAKDGCWEAEIIVLMKTINFEQEFIDKIKAVSTQKIVVGFSCEKDMPFPVDCKTNNLPHLLPYSKVVQVFNRTGATKVYAAGNDKKAVQTILDIIERLDHEAIIVDSLSDIPEGN